MANEKYIVPADAEYRIHDIRKLQNSDPANADTTFNPVIQPILESTECLNREKADKTELAAGLGGKADLVDGKVPVVQLPEMNYDPSGSAADVQQQLDIHLDDIANPHGVTAAQVGLGKTLTFTGAISASYNGATARTVNIPAGKRTCRFVIGTSTAGWTENDCDYLCDGEDDQMEINAAIQALPENGGEIHLLDGTFIITNPILINREYVSLTGNFDKSVLKRSWNSGTSATSTNVTEGIVSLIALHCSITDLTIDGNSDEYGYWDNALIYFENAAETTISHNSLKNSAWCIYGNLSNDSLVCENRIFEIIFSCIQLSTCHGSHIRGNIINESRGILTAGGDRIVAVGNGIFNTSQGDFGLSIRGEACVTANNIVKGYNYGISINSSCKRSIITGNVVRDCNNGIMLFGGENLLISENNIYRGTGQSSDYTADQYTIRIYGTVTVTKYCMFISNLIMGKNYVSDGGTGNIFVNNKYN